eukprot:1894486-Pleurochrysis_carterae.AAC.1
MPSGRLKGPEKRRSTVRESQAGSRVSGISRGISWTRLSGSSVGEAAGKPDGWSDPVSGGMAAIGGAQGGALDLHG